MYQYLWNKLRSELSSTEYKEYENSSITMAKVIAKMSVMEFEALEEKRNEEKNKRYPFGNRESRD